MMEGRKVDWRHICSCVQSGNNASETSFVGRFIDQITIHVVRCYLAIHPSSVNHDLFIIRVALDAGMYLIMEGSQGTHTIQHYRL